MLTRLQLTRRVVDSDWTGGLVLFALFAATQVAVRAAGSPGFFDEGISLAAVSWARDGMLPLGDAYTPYGPGMALPGLFATSVFGREAFVVFTADAIAGAGALVIAFALVHRRVGVVMATGVALIATLGSLPRYAIPVGFVLAGAYLLDRCLDRSGRALSRALEEDPRGVALAIAPIGLAAWFRPEWAVFVVVWAFVAWRAFGYRRPPVAPLAAPAVVAAVPFVALVATAGFRHVWWWLDYALFRYSDERKTPSHPSDAIQAVTDRIWGDAQQTGAVLLVSYGAAAALVLLAAANRLLPSERRFIRPDPSGLSLFLLLSAGIAAYMQSKRFFAGNGAAVAALIWSAIAVQRFHSRAVLPVLVTMALVAVAPSIWNQINLPKALSRVDDRPADERGAAQVPGLRRLRLSRSVADDLGTFRTLWLDRHSTRAKTFVVNARNQDAWGNNMIMYWLLVAIPAAWPATFDPGLADRDEVQREALESLCRVRPDIVQHTASYQREPFTTRSGSLRLDQALAVGWDDVGGTGLHRLLRSRREVTCPVDPGRLPTTDLAARRDALVRADRLSAAGSLARVLVDRAVARRAVPPARDWAAALLGDYWIPDAALPSGDEGIAARALRDGARGRAAEMSDETRGAVVRVALGRHVDPYTRLVAIRVYREHLLPGPDKERDAVVGMARDLAGRHPWAAVFVRALVDFGIGGSRLARDLRAEGGSGRWFDTWTLQQTVNDHDLDGSLVALERVALRWPGERLAIFDGLNGVANLMAKSGSPKCARVLLGQAISIRDSAATPGLSRACPKAAAVLELTATLNRPAG